jgi:hypothetical protein
MPSRRASIMSFSGLHCVLSCHAGSPIPSVPHGACSLGAFCAWRSLCRRNTRRRHPPAFPAQEISCRQSAHRLPPPGSRLQSSTVSCSCAVTAAVFCVALDLKNSPVPDLAMNNSRGVGGDAGVDSGRFAVVDIGDIVAHSGG